MKIVGAVSFAHNTPTGLPNIIKICQRVSKLWSAQGCIYGRMNGRHADRYIPQTYWLGNKKSYTVFVQISKS